MVKFAGGSVFLLAAICLTALGGIAAVFLLATERIYSLKSYGDESKVITVLFVFENDGNPVASYLTIISEDTKRVAVFDIPVNVGLIIKRLNRVDSIDTVYDRLKLADFTSQIEGLLGISIVYTIAFDVEKIGRVVDVLDGVRIFIPQVLTDEKDGKVLFPSGWIDLDGDKARSYILYQDDNNASEIDRERRKRFFIGLIKRIGEGNDRLKDGKVARLLNSSLKSNMNRRTLAKLLNEFALVDSGAVIIQDITGENRKISGQTLLIPHYDGALVKDVLRQTLRSISTRGQHNIFERLITIEVLNGTATAGLAGRTAEFLREFGYDVANVGNAAQGSVYEKTEIISRIDNDGEIENFSKLVNCSNVRMELPEAGEETPGENYEYKPDFTLIIGADYNGQFIR